MVEEGAVLGQSAFKGCSYITDVTIKNGVEIGFGAFQTHPFKDMNITTVVIGNNVTNGKSAFRYSLSIRTIAIGENSSMGTNAFEGNSLNSPLVSLSLGSGTTLSTGAFASNGNLVTATLPVDMTQIAAYAFDNCATLTSVNFGRMSQLTVIHSYAFRNTAVTLPQGLVNILRLGEDVENWVVAADRCRLYKRVNLWEVKPTCCSEPTPYLTDNIGCVSACPDNTIKFTSVTSMQCQECDPGLKSSDDACVSCAGNIYDDGSTGGICETCLAGKESNEDKTGCQKCIEGEYSNSTSYRCTYCPNNHWAPKGSDACTPFSRGYYQGSVVCYCDGVSKSLNDCDGERQCYRNGFRFILSREELCTACLAGTYSKPGWFCSIQEYDRVDAILSNATQLCDPGYYCAPTKKASSSPTKLPTKKASSSPTKSPTKKEAKAKGKKGKKGKNEKGKHI